jgi:cellulose synthase/poly-beta-1,6-N-acetylglucosamine synthase-like glycosyltransferase
MVIKLHRHFRELRQKYRIVFTPDPLCWTEVPATFGELRAQRNMWERGTLEVLWRHKRMLFNPRYGLVGVVGIPYLWIFEAGAAFVETLGYLYVVLAAIFGFLNVEFLLLFLTLAFVYGALMSELGMGIETLLLTRYERARDRLLLMLAAFVEYLGMRQAIVVNRAIAIFQVRSKRGRYPTKTSRQQPTLPVRAAVTSAEDADLVLR